MAEREARKMFGRVTGRRKNRRFEKSAGQESYMFLQMNHNCRERIFRIGIPTVTAIMVRTMSLGMNMVME